MSTTFGILLFDDVEELDFAGPWEVFAMAAQGRDEDARVVTIAERAEPVRAAHGLRVIPDHDFDSAPALDVLLVPGGQGTRREVDNAVLLEWIRKSAARCQWITSVCTGSLLLCAAGVAKGKRITTHWTFVETLRERGDATVLDGVRYVRDGNLVTSAGVSAGIDMALWLVGQLYEPDYARKVQRFMEYDPAPPYAAEV
jgi:transcriptional regulator GlxA family with amidase domain